MASCGYFEHRGSAEVDGNLYEIPISGGFIPSRFFMAFGPHRRTQSLFGGSGDAQSMVWR
jgi:hypothetical protein